MSYICSAAVGIAINVLLFRNAFKFPDIAIFASLVGITFGAYRISHFLRMRRKIAALRDLSGRAMAVSIAVSGIYASFMMFFGGEVDIDRAMSFQIILSLLFTPLLVVQFFVSTRR